jgi:beta-galactosidase GanA
MNLFWILVAVLTTGVLGASGRRENDKLPPLTYNDTSFFYDGEPILLLGGQMDPQRIPREYWRDRLKMAKAMGLNTILTYPFWDLLEPKEGQWSFDGENNLAEYFRIAGEEGLMTSLRLGPYVCGEHTFGGLPAWLINKNGEVRTSKGDMDKYHKKYMQRLYDHVKDQLASNGGSIVMVQIENEYGAYGDDHNYTAGLRDMAIEVGFDVLLYTTDQPNKDTAEKGNIPNTLQEFDGKDADVRYAQDYIPEDSSKGPFMNTEYYTYWYDHFNSSTPHEQINDDEINKAKSQLSDLINKHHGSFSLYMFHGGTSFGFQAGANWAGEGYFQPDTTSYDYSAPLGESGRTTKLYDALREMLVDYWKTANSSYKVPDVPEQSSPMKTDKIKLNACKRVLDNLPAKANTDEPTNMEALDQYDGFINFRSSIDKDVEGDLSVGDAPRDRVIVYVNDKRKGLLDARFVNNPKINLDLKKGDKLDLFIENMGRINYKEKMKDQRKGIVGDVTINNEKIESWEIYNLPFDDITEYSENCSSNIEDSPSSFTPTVYSGEFDLDKTEDTFLSTDGWTKGMVWINNHNLGKYWTIGPQQQLYVPKPWLKQGKNKIAILELVGTNSTQVQGLDKRSWYNNPDPELH